MDSQRGHRGPEGIEAGAPNVKAEQTRIAYRCDTSKMPRSAGLTCDESIAIIAKSSVTLNYPLTKEHVKQFGKALVDAREKHLQLFAGVLLEEQLSWNDFQKHHKGFVAQFCSRVFSISIAVAISQFSISSC